MQGFFLFYLNLTHAPFWTSNVLDVIKPPARLILTLYLHLLTFGKYFLSFKTPVFA